MVFAAVVMYYDSCSSSVNSSVTVVVAMVLVVALIVIIAVAAEVNVIGLVLAVLLFALCLNY